MLIRNIEQWFLYFKNNAKDDLSISWDTQEALSEDEITRISQSIAKFQLGEYSEGKGLMKFAREFAKTYETERLVEITSLFIKEEQRHSQLLKRFMEKHGIATTKKSWTDSVFRHLRKNVGYEASVTVLITAELIALSYYKCLARCTNSIVLKEICNKINLEETKHIEYESEIINHIRHNNSQLKRSLAYFLHSGLYFGTVIVVFLDHRKVIVNGGSCFADFWKSCWRDYLQHFKNIQGQSEPSDSHE